MFGSRFALPVLLLVTAFGCSDSPDSSDGGVDAGMCEARAEAFSDFVAANRDCSDGSGCTIIGDCGPNADFTAVRSDAAEEGRRLMQDRCAGAYDGPRYSAGCEAGQCVAVMTGSYCGMIALPDSGADGSADAMTDASVDASTDASVDASSDASAVDASSDASGAVDASGDA